MISTAHLFYIPVLVLVGAFAGYYVGRAAADKEAREKAKAARRKRAIAQRLRASSGEEEE